MDNNKYRGFKDLECWKIARTLRKDISNLSGTFPSHENFLLKDQIRRASRSITANIAEGYGRYTYLDTRHFFVQARGSVTETIDHLTVALDEGYINESRCDELEQLCELIFKLINGFIGYLDKSRKKN